MPPSVTLPLAVTTIRTVISFLVRVPVLSDAMTFAEPSVSTAARCRTMAFRPAMRCTPSDKTAVTTAGKPSGTAATASATPRINTSKMAVKPLTSSTTMIVTIITMAMMMTMTPSSFPVRSSSFCRGVVSGDALLSIPAMRPISVSIPVATTTARPCPYVAAVPLKIILCRSPREASFCMGAASFGTGKLSPVNAASAV